MVESTGLERNFSNLLLIHQVKTKVYNHNREGGLVLISTFTP